MLGALKQILDDQGGQDTEGLIEAITRAEDGEDVDIADLVDQFSEVRKRVA